MELELFLSNRLSENIKRLDIVRKELKQCCRGTITKTKKGSRVYYVQYYYDKGKRVRKGITNQPEVIKSLLRRRVLEHEAQYLISEQRSINHCANLMKEFNIENELDDLQREFPELDLDIIKSTITTKSNNEWQDKPYEQSVYKPENKRHVTSRGLFVRSKSEVLIAEKLYQYNIPFHYEEIMHVDSQILVPDFLIRLSSEKLIIWEHMGLMGNDVYRSRQKRKIELYESFGFVPWDNLIVTYDTSDGLIDLRIIESEIKNKLL